MVAEPPDRHGASGDGCAGTVPAVLASDISQSAQAFLTGALLRQLDRLLMEETGIPVVVAEDPIDLRRLWRRKRRWKMIDTTQATLFEAKSSR